MNYTTLINTNKVLKRVILLVVILCSSGYIKGQTKALVDTVCIDNHVYYAPNNISLDQAKHEAINHARAEALAKRYGTMIMEHSTMFSNEVDDKFYENFVSFLSSEEKGKWLCDIGEPKLKIDYGETGLVITVSLCGEAKELNSNVIDLEIKTLRNGVEPKFESDMFRANDDFYLWLKSPQSGYMVAYLVDGSTKAYCLLPYLNSKESRVEIKKDIEYVFFSPKHAVDNEIVDELTITCANQLEYNRLYVVYSPKPFTKAIDSFTSELMPRELSYAEFQQWLTKQHLYNDEMTLVVKDLLIKK